MERQLFINYSDDGKGMKPGIESVGIGIRNARERAALLKGSFRLDNAWPEGYFHRKLFNPIPMSKDQSPQDLPPYESLLVIDDHNMIVNGIRLLTGSWFANFYHANDGATGIRLAVEHQPQLVIVDQLLPDCPGDAVVKEIKYKCPVTRILGYSFTVTPASIIKIKFESGLSWLCHQE